MPSWLSKPLLGVPTWGWLIALAVTGGAVVFFLRNRSASSSAQNSTGTPGAGVGTVAVPYPVYSTPSPQSNTGGPLVPSNLAQWTWSGTGWFPNPKNLPPGWAWGQSGAYWIGGGPAYGHFVWTDGGWMPDPSNPPPDWVPEFLPSGNQLGNTGVNPSAVAGNASSGFGGNSTPGVFTGMPPEGNVSTQSMAFGNAAGVAQQPSYIARS